MRDEAELEGLESAVAALKEDVPVRQEWRDKLLSAIDEQPVRRSRTSIVAWVALAACAAGVAIGVIGDRALSHKALPQVRLVYVAPTATTVAVAGDFNQWKPAALRRLDDGRTWVTDLPLSAGRYAYTFVVDGHMVPDPAAPSSVGDDFGVKNSVLVVRGQ